MARRVKGRRTLVAGARRVAAKPAGKKPTLTIGTYAGANGDYFFRIRNNRNGLFEADGSEGYTSRSNATRAVRVLIRRLASGDLEIVKFDTDRSC